jgi:hypothetical protein
LEIGVSDESYYIRWRGRLTGPFTLPQLQDMIAQERMTKLHDVSSDQVRWRRAGTYSELFPAFLPGENSFVARAPGTYAIHAEQTIPVGDLPPVDSGLDDWYYARGQQVEGPVPAATIIDMVQQGALTAEDHVNRSSDPSVWQQIAEVPEFAPLVAAPDGAAGPHAASAEDYAWAAGAAAGGDAEGGAYGGWAFTGLALGIVGIIAPLFGIGALLCGAKAKRGILASGGTGHLGIARAAVVLGAIDLGFDVVKLGVLLAFLVKPLLA